MAPITELLLKQIRSSRVKSLVCEALTSRNAGALLDRLGATAPTILTCILECVTSGRGKTHCRAVNNIVTPEVLAKDCEANFQLIRFHKHLRD